MRINSSGVSPPRGIVPDEKDDDLVRVRLRVGVASVSTASGITAAFTGATTRVRRTGEVFGTEVGSTAD